MRKYFYSIKNITKYSVTIRNPYDCLYGIQKALYLCKSGRPGPVWVEIPLDVQAFKIKDYKSLRNFKNEGDCFSRRKFPLIKE